MKTIFNIVLASAFALVLFSCSKKEEQVSPSGNAPKLSAKEFNARVQKIAEQVNPVFVQTSSNTATFTSGSQSGTIYFSGNTTQVKFNDNTPSAKFTVVAPTFFTTGTSPYSPGSNPSSGGGSLVSGAMQTIFIELNESNIDRFDELISGNIFESLFDTTTSNMFGGDGGDEANFVFAPKLNTDSLPSGAISTITIPRIISKGDAPNSLGGILSRTTESSSAKLLEIQNQAGIFEMVQDSVMYAELFPGLSFLFGGQYNGGSKLVYNGTTYEGINLSESSGSGLEKPSYFSILFGIGAGDASKVSGIQIGWGIHNTERKAVLIIGVFGDIQIPN